MTGSAHGAGINVCNGDGSVSTIEFGIEREIYQQMGHRANGTDLIPDEPEAGLN